MKLREALARIMDWCMGKRRCEDVMNEQEATDDCLTMGIQIILDLAIVAGARNGLREAVNAIDRETRTDTTDGTMIGEKEIEAIETGAATMDTDPDDEFNRVENLTPDT